MNKKILTAVLGLGLAISATSCGYVPTFEYEAVNPGQLQAPSVDRKSDDYRKKYATIERYDETVTLDVAVCQFELEAGVKLGTTPENQSFNKIAKDVLTNAGCATIKMY